jgi:hypothetical protein
MGEASLLPAYGRDVDADPPHAELMPVGKLRVGHRGFIEIDDAAPDRRIHLTHRIEHVGVVEAIGARLHEHEALEPDAPRELQVGLKRLMWRR